MEERLSSVTSEIQSLRTFPKTKPSSGGEFNDNLYGQHPGHNANWQRSSFMPLRSSIHQRVCVTRHNHLCIVRAASYFPSENPCDKTIN